MQTNVTRPPDLCAGDTGGVNARHSGSRRAPSPTAPSQSLRRREERLWRVGDKFGRLNLSAGMWGGTSSHEKPADPWHEHFKGKQRHCPSNTAQYPFITSLDGSIDDAEQDQRPQCPGYGHYPEVLRSRSIVPDVPCGSLSTKGIFPNLAEYRYCKRFANACGSKCQTDHSERCNTDPAFS